MPSITAIETIAQLAAEAGEKILPARLQNVIESMSGKAGLAANRLSGSHLDGPSESTIGSSLRSSELPELTIGHSAENEASDKALSGLSLEREKLIVANQALVNHVTDLMPQVQDGQLDWVLGGSSAANALAGSRTITILDAAQLPAIASARTIQLSNTAIDSFQKFARPVSDIDAFVVNGGKNKFLQSPHVASMGLVIPDAASAALKHTGDARFSPLIQGVKMEFANPEVAAVDLDGKTTYLIGPGQLLGNKFRQVLFSYAPADAAKLTGDFSHLLDAASTIYSEPELMQFGKQALERNNFLYEGDALVPWDKSETNTKFLGFMRKVLENDERNGSFLQGLNIDSKDSISAIRVFEKHALPEDKTAIAEFINRHGDFVRSLDVTGSPERAMYMQQGGFGKASEKFMSMLDDLNVRNEMGQLGAKEQLQKLDAQLSESSNLPALVKVVHNSRAGIS